MTLNIPTSHPDLEDYYESVRQAMESAGTLRRFSVGNTLRFDRGIHPLTGDRWVYMATDARGRSIYGSLIHGPRD